MNFFELYFAVGFAISVLIVWNNCSTMSIFTCFMVWFTATMPLCVLAWPFLLAWIGYQILTKPDSEKTRAHATEVPNKEPNGMKNKVENPPQQLPSFPGPFSQDGRSAETLPPSHYLGNKFGPWEVIEIKQATQRARNLSIFAFLGAHLIVYISASAFSVSFVALFPFVLFLTSILSGAIYWRRFSKITKHLAHLDLGHTGRRGCMFWVVSGFVLWSISYALFFFLK